MQLSSPRDIWRRLETFLVVTSGDGEEAGMLLASSGERLGRLLNTVKIHRTALHAEKE